MLVDTMSYEEMALESNRIIETYTEKARERFKPDKPEFKKLMRYMLKHKVLTYVIGKPVSYKISTTNTFYSVPLIPNYRSFKRLMRPVLIPFITYQNSHGMNVITRCVRPDERMFILYFTSHFFARYIQRFSVTNVSKMEAIIKFMGGISALMMLPFPTRKNPNNMIGLCNNVICFGEMMTSNIAIIRTCIRRDQLYESQTEVTDEIDKVLIEEAKRMEEILNSYPKSPRQICNSITEPTM